MTTFSAKFLLDLLTMLHPLYRLLKIIFVQTVWSQGRSEPLAAACIQCWALILSAYTYKIEYVQGSANQCAECITRLPRSATSIHPAEREVKYMQWPLIIYWLLLN